jgi:hypothetical protein
MPEHILEGIEPDNLLGFLALLGFQRALDCTEPNWCTRVYWGGLPARPRLLLPLEVGRKQLLEAAVKGCQVLASVHDFGDSKDINFTCGEARDRLDKESQSARPANRMRIDLLSALTSDAVARDDGTVKATPFCAMFGQGHQHFLERLEDVPKGTLPKELAKRATLTDLNAPEKLEQALFSPWERRDATQSFRWDPLEDRRYALRFEDPSTDKGMTMHGANRLASLALPLLPVVPARVRGKTQLSAVGTAWVPGTGLCVSWPIWSRAARLRSIIAMLASAGEDLKGRDGLGIIRIYRAERISVGKFFNFTRALPI